jgi:CRP-like cAMP-binding protein
MLSEVWSLPPFRSLSADEARAVADVGEWITFGPKTIVVKQGEPGDYFYVVAQGQLEVVEKRSVVRVLHAGDFFGEVALLYDVPRTATVRSVTPVRLFRLDRKAFRAALLKSFRRDAAGTDYARRAMRTRPSSTRRRAMTPAKITR